MSTHDGITCDACGTTNFTGMRHKCLVCFDYDLCHACALAGASSKEHNDDHPLQTIVPSADAALFFGDATRAAASFSCPFCPKRGLSERRLIEHVFETHQESPIPAICPICAGRPGGTNSLFHDLARHLEAQHGRPRAARAAASISDGGVFDGYERLDGATWEDAIDADLPRPDERKSMAEQERHALRPAGRDSHSLSDLLAFFQNREAGHLPAESSLAYSRLLESENENEREYAHAILERDRRRPLMRHLPGGKDSAQLPPSLAGAVAPTNHPTAAALPSRSPSSKGTTSVTPKRESLLPVDHEVPLSPENQRERILQTIFVQDLVLSSMMSDLDDLNVPNDDMLDTDMDYSG